MGSNPTTLTKIIMNKICPICDKPIQIGEPIHMHSSELDMISHVSCELDINPQNITMTEFNSYITYLHNSSAPRDQIVHTTVNYMNQG